MRFTTHVHSDRTRRRRLAALAIAGLSLSVVQSTAVDASTTVPETPPADGVALRLVSSQAASVGDVVAVEVWADGMTGASAFEVVATIAPDAGRIIAAMSDEALGRDDMSIGDATGFAVLAGYSSDGSAIAESTVRLGTFDVRLDAEGLVGIDIGESMIVDAAGAEIPVGDTGPASILVGASSAPRSAAPMPWSLTSRGAGDDTELMSFAPELAMEWQSTRLAGDPCAGDVAAAAGGCVEIGDVQRLSGASTPSSRSGTTRQGPYRLTVDSRGDDPDSRIGDGVCATAAGRCTLRAAIQEANAISGPNLIAFALRGNEPFRIETTRRLPVMEDTTGRTIVNGYTQPTAQPNTAKRASNARILVEVVGVGANGHDGFAIRSGGNVLRGLSVYAFRRPVWIYRTGENAPGNRIVGSFIGTDPTGQYREPNRVDFAHGIHIEQGSPKTKIGGKSRAARNVISGNGFHGIGMWHRNTDGAVIRNNIIGLSPFGDRRLMNQQHGIDMNFGVSDTRVGGKKASQRNVISGNSFNGLEVSHRASTRNNRVVGNFIGTRLSGKSTTVWTGNGGSGMWIEDGASNNRFTRNVIGGNREGGIRILNDGTNGTSSENVIRNNRIGVSKANKPLPQGSVGIFVEGASNLIRGNVIAHHAAQGITVSGAFARYNTFTRNRIHSNGGLSIDISPLGAVNENDPGDADTGPNARQNFPVLTDATRNSVRGVACAGCRVEVFAAGSEGNIDPRHGPAYRYLGAAVAGEDGRFQVEFRRTAAEGAWLSSTATNLTGSTSEMSRNVQVPVAAG
jgi:hypothetical protein